MTQREAMLEQRRLELSGFDLGWYFGTDCEKCCGVYPRFCTKDVNDRYHDSYYKCDVCGKQTDLWATPSQCAEKWNNHEYLGAGVQLSFL